MLPPHRQYKSALFKVVQDVDKALQQVYPNKKLWNVSELDSGRLTRLMVWSERYGVSLEYILETILGYHYASMPKHNRLKASQSRSMGIRIPTLVGPVSFAVLREHLYGDFNTGTNLDAFKEEEKERIADLLETELPPKAKGVLAFKTLTQFVSSYERTIERRRTGVNRIERKMNKIAWRGNPWR